MYAIFYLITPACSWFFSFPLLVGILVLASWLFNTRVDVDALLYKVRGFLTGIVRFCIELCYLATLGRLLLEKSKLLCVIGCIIYILIMCIAVRKITDIEIAYDAVSSHKSNDYLHRSIFTEAEHLYLLFLFSSHDML